MAEVASSTADGPKGAPSDRAPPGGLFDASTAGWLASFAVHLIALFVLAAATVLIPIQTKPVLTSTPYEVIEELTPPELEYNFSNDPSETLGALSDHGTGDPQASAPLEDLLSQVTQDVQATSLLGDVQGFDPAEPAATSPQVVDQRMVKGIGSVGATGAAGAVDRITREILTSLDQRPTLVAWLFDQSGSLKPQREEIAQRFDRVYDELGVIRAAGDSAFKKTEEKPLLTVVASFGADNTLLTPEPTDEIDEIRAAVRAIADDAAGEENVFSAIGELAQRYRHYRLKSPRRNVMIVVFTDEAGNDIDRVDATVDLCRRLEMPVYVVGVPAPFGQRQAYVKYIDPDPRYDQTPQAIPVDQGPESLLPERIRLRFVGQREDETLDSGFGPFALSRLCYETGGVYFTVHPNREMGKVEPWETSPMAAYMSRFFDPRLMRRYRPDYVSVAEYKRGVTTNRAKSALLEAAAMTADQPLQDVQLVFERVDDAQLAESLSRAQRAAAVLEPKLAQLVATLRQGEQARRSVTEPRWQAGYDLALGRALAAQVRTEGYNTMLAQAKLGMAFKNPKNDTWVLRPSDNISTGSVLARAADKSLELLRAVAKEHAGTPWAVYAERELATPLGWEWGETFHDVAGRIARLEEMANMPRPERPENPVPPPKKLRPLPKL